MSEELVKYLLAGMASGIVGLFYVCLRLGLALLAEKNARLQERDVLIAEKDALLLEQQNQIAEDHKLLEAVEAVLEQGAK